LADGTKDVKKKKKGIGTFGFFGPEIAQANSHIAVGLEPASELSQLPKQLKASAIDRRA